jgi:hypothetical protein
MANAKKKPVARRSRKSGLKSQKVTNNNQQILRKLINELKLK